MTETVRHGSELSCLIKVILYFLGAEQIINDKEQSNLTIFHHWEKMSFENCIFYYAPPPLLHPKREESIHSLMISVAWFFFTKEAHKTASALLPPHSCLSDLFSHNICQPNQTSKFFRNNCRTSLVLGKRELENTGQVGHIQEKKWSNQVVASVNWKMWMGFGGGQTQVQRAAQSLQLWEGWQSASS